MEADSPKAALRFFLENADYIDSSDEKEVEAHYTADQLQKYENMYSEMIEGLLNKLVKSHVSKDQFYEQIWKGIIEEDIIVEERDAKIFALAKLWSDPRIPYFSVNVGMKMSNEEFAQIINDKKELFQEATFVLGCKFEQRTESSSLLLDIINRCTNEKEKIVVMAHILDMVERKILLKLFHRE